MKYCLVLLLILTSSAYSVCMTQIDGESYGCLRIKEDKRDSGDKWCQKKYGQYFLSYFTDNTCSKELAANLRGETYKTKRSDYTKEVPAACLSYEQGIKLECEYYEYDAAQRFCSNRYGARYLPFIPSKTCSLKVAAKLRGEKSGKYLVEGLSSSMDEIESIMTMIDRQNVNFSLLGFHYKKPDLQEEFYTDIIQSLMAKMNMFKKQMKKNGLHNVALEDRETLSYIKYAFRYLGVLSRLYKVYAYVAHNNQFVLKSYDFKNLEYLNLELKKVYALEVLAKVNFTAKSSEDGSHIEFIIGALDRQTYEFAAMENPDTKKEYAKLVTFMGARNTLTNLWGVQRLSPKPISNANVSSCGNFLSLRPGADHKMQSSSAIKEMEDYDLFYTDYAVRAEDLILASKDVQILSEQTAADMAYNALKYTPELYQFLTTDIAQPLETRADFKALAQSDAPMYVDAENGYWLEFAYSNFLSITMPGDSIQDKDAIIKRIVAEAYRRRAKGITESFVSAYLWISDAGIKTLEARINKYLDEKLKASFEKRLTQALESELANYNDKAAIATKNRAEKEEETLTVIRGAARAIYASKLLEDNNLLYHDSFELLGPETVEELMMYFQNLIGEEYADIQKTLETNEEFAMELNEFFTNISKKFVKNHTHKNAQGYLEYKGTRLEREKGLRRIALEEAAVFREKYPAKPFSLDDLNANQYNQMNNYLNNPAGTTYVAQAGTTYVAPTYIQNIDFKPFEITAPQYDVSNIKNPQGLVERYDYSLDVPHYVAQVDNTYVHQNYGYTEIIKPYSLISNFGDDGTAPDAGYNKDMITTGEISAPLEIIDPGKIKTAKGITNINNKALMNLLASFNLFSSKGQKALKNKQNQIMPAFNFNNNIRPITDKRAFFYRVFSALNIQPYHRVGSRDTESYFADTEKGQEYFATLIASSAHNQAPILRADYTWSTTHTYTTAGNYGNDFQGRTGTKTRSHSMPLGKKIALESFNPKNNTFKDSRAKQLISIMFDRAISNTGSKLETFCKANYLNYKNSPSFKKVYEASKFTRMAIRSGAGLDDAFVAKMEKFDEEVRKDIRSAWTAFNEDYLEPALHVLGIAALIAIGIIMIIGSAGTAAPGVIGIAYSVATVFLSVEFIVSFPLVVGSLYARINTNFYETPAQLKFQTSIAMSQIGDSKIVDWDMLDQDKADNKSSKGWTIALMPLDFLYGASIVRAGARGTGIVGRAAFKRLTGIKLKGFSAPVKSMRTHVSYLKLGKKIGYFKALKPKFQSIKNNIMMYTPKFQAVPENLIKSTSVRMGIIKASQRAGIAAKPWALADEIRTYAAKLKERLEYFTKYSIREGKIVESVKLKGRLKFSELKEHGLQYSKASFVPKGLREALFTSLKKKSVKPFKEFFSNFGEAWGKIKFTQGEMVKLRMAKMDNVLAKLDDFQKANAAGKVAGENKMAEFLRTLSDDEILILEEISKKSKGLMANFKSVFKDYKKVIQGIKPIAYAHGFGGQEFALNQPYPSHLVMSELSSSENAIRNEADDLLNYYESMMYHHGDNTEPMRNLRVEIESWLEKEFVIDSKGVAQRVK